MVSAILDPPTSSCVFINWNATPTQTTLESRISDAHGPAMSFHSTLLLCPGSERYRPVWPGAVLSLNASPQVSRRRRLYGILDFSNSSARISYTDSPPLWQPEHHQNRQESWTPQQNIIYWSHVPLNSFSTKEKEFFFHIFRHRRSNCWHLYKTTSSWASWKI